VLEGAPGSPIDFEGRGGEEKNSCPWVGSLFE